MQSLQAALGSGWHNWDKLAHIRSRVQVLLAKEDNREASSFSTSGTTSEGMGVIQLK